MARRIVTADELNAAIARSRKSLASLASLGPFNLHPHAPRMEEWLTPEIEAAIGLKRDTPEVLHLEPPAHNKREHNKRKTEARDLELNERMKQLKAENPKTPHYLLCEILNQEIGNRVSVKRIRRITAGQS
jgi:hypothetical protein